VVGHKKAQKAQKEKLLLAVFFSAFCAFSWLKPDLDETLRRATKRNGIDEMMDDFFELRYAVSLREDQRRQSNQVTSMNGKIRKEPVDLSRYSRSRLVSCR
jgi:hypothetical protein